MLIPWILYYYYLWKCSIKSQSHLDAQWLYVVKYNSVWMTGLEGWSLGEELIWKYKTVRFMFINKKITCQFFTALLVNNKTYITHIVNIWIYLTVKKLIDDNFNQ